VNRLLLLDTGPLVALLDRGDAHHDWAVEQWSRAKGPLPTCEAVLSEACFLLRHLMPGPRAVMEAVRRGAVDVSWRLADHAERVSALMAKYAQAPMSLADACLVCMAEVNPRGIVFTMDGHFHTYRKHGRTAIPTLMPDV
jgi:predicted nucleic acid-binding protein